MNKLTYVAGSRRLTLEKVGRKYVLTRFRNDHKTSVSEIFNKEDALYFYELEKDFARLAHKRERCEL